MGPSPIGASRRSLRLAFQLPSFALFLRAGVHCTDAERHLAPEQIDAVDVESLLADLTPTAGSS